VFDFSTENTELPKQAINQYRHWGRSGYKCWNANVVLWVTECTAVGIL